MYCFHVALSAVPDLAFVFFLLHSSAAACWLCSRCHVNNSWSKLITQQTLENCEVDLFALVMNANAGIGDGAPTTV